MALTPADLAHNRSAHMVRKAVAEHFGAAVEVVNDDTHLGNHLGGDDLDRIELVLEIEREFGVRMSNEEFTEFETVGDLVAIVLRLEAQKSAAA